MKKILVATVKPFAPAAVAEIKKIVDAAGYEFILLEKYAGQADFIKAVEDVDALIIRSDKADKDVIAAAKNLKIIVRAGAGYDNIDLGAASAKGIVAMNTPGQNSNAVAELAVGMMVFLARGQFNGKSGTELRGKTIGIHAYGHVGKLHIPANEHTKKSIGFEILSSMPKNAVLVNTARKEVIDEDGLLKVMAERGDFKYISDIAPDCAPEFAANYDGRYLFTPKKMGAQTAEANINAGIASANQIVNFLEKGDVTFQVNK
ncbi:MAG: 3-phosphoglycerate dehydrogenase [Bacteroidetes bacterium 4572_114]|nr:MAG: 3-phosphoglycerate dehydrogenase [Bacteroidetes bacterium 4572_114]